MDDEVGDDSDSENEEIRSGSRKIQGADDETSANKRSKLNAA